MGHKKYPKIGQFRNAIDNIRNTSNYMGKDSDGKPIYDDRQLKPTLTCIGRVKIHGTNAAVCIKNDEYWVQSRNNIIRPDSDNCGFATFAHKNKDIFMKLFDKINYPKEKNTTFIIYGEWAGSDIQKGVAVSELKKQFYIFGVKIIENDTGGGTEIWFPYEHLRDHENNIYNITDFGKYKIEIDFNNPELSQNQLIKLTEEVERECPVGKYFGINGTGEGIVWTTRYKNDQYMFKVKGKEHSVTKVKTLANVDVEKINSIIEFIDYSLTQQRFDQAMENVCGQHKYDISKLGKIIRWIINDILNEEFDTLKKNNLTKKNVSKYISTRVREMCEGLPFN